MSSNDKVLQYFNGDILASNTWKDKYQLKDKNSNPIEETPDDMHRRMAREFARVMNKDKKNNIDRTTLSEYGQKRQELTEEPIYNYFKDFKYIIPQGSIMSVLGNPNVIGSLSNCFVLGQPYDSYGGIMQKDQELVQVMKRRGGAGIDISTLRPKNSKVQNTAETSTGAISFMERFSHSTREVAQDGRRGALMLSIDVRHPDVADFINIKKDLTKVTGANISVKLRNDFMQAVKEDKSYLLRFPVDIEFPIMTKFGNITQSLSPEFDLSYNKTIEYTYTNYGKIYIRMVKAREYFNTLVENAWLSAEPGIMYIDNHLDYAPDSPYERYRAVTTNPCGEIAMGKHDACRLLALNLLSIIDNPFTEKASINYDKLYEIAYEQQRIADALVDLELEHISEILLKIAIDPEPDEVKQVEKELWERIFDTCSSSRRTGCGFTALGDMIAALGLKYDSEEAINIINKVMEAKFLGELDCTIDLSIEKGSFNDWNKDLEFKNKGLFLEGTNKFFDFIGKNYISRAIRMYKYGRRNVSWSTVAPTGSVSILTQTSSGIEPLFKAYYIRKRKVTDNEEFDYEDNSGDKWKEYIVLHPQFKNWMLNNISLWCDSRIESPYLSQEGFIYSLSKEHILKAFQQSPWYGSEADDIDWQKRVMIQGIVQKYTTHSISSTINLPRNVDKEVVRNIYEFAWEAGLKGVTVYREGSRDGVLITESAKTKKEEFVQHDAPSRPQSLEGVLHKVIYKGEKYGVIIGLMENKPYEVFAFKGINIKNHVHGNIIKKGKGVYNFVSSSVEIENIQLGDENAEEGLLCRMISMMLRHGAKINFVLDQIGKVSLNVTSFSKVISRVLKLYVESGVKSGNTCPDCGESSLVYEEGCKKCLNCSYTAC
jgi:ribonucleoside-diphosphate reductase alpha chain